MEKLLHERLRDFPKNSFYDELGETLGLGAKPDDELLGDYWDRIIPALASEIERDYIPRPRYEDGESVQFGMEFADCSGGSHILHEIWYRDKSARGMGAGCVLRAAHSDPMKHDSIAYQLFDTDSVKRPSPKVLDADGVPIKEGDTVWSVGLGSEYIVFKVYESGSVDVGWPKDDRPIGGIDADKLTHKEPDSLEKLRDDMRNDKGASLSSFASRFLAIMERDV